MNANQNNSQESVTVEVRGLRKGFSGQPVLKGLSFRVEQGEIFVIMGPSGSGKSVLLKHIIGLELPDEGEILIDGESITEPGVMAKHRLAMVFQSGALLNSLSVGENVGLYLVEHRLKTAHEVKQIVHEKLDIVGLAGTEHKMPNELSGGMKKRVAIARALVVEPQLILYDEPTSELDPLMSVTVGEEIVALNHRIHATSIVVSHDRELAFGIADRMAIIFDGEIIFIGKPDEVKKHSDPRIKEFIHAEHQFKKKKSV
ncbi:MAG: transporter related [Verrucomicrobiales bacterium]|nr:transporter related [Verrucomicrobiales bacterium]